MGIRTIRPISIKPIAIVVITAGWVDIGDELSAITVINPQFVAFVAGVSVEIEFVIKGGQKTGKGTATTRSDISSNLSRIAVIDP